MANNPINWGNALNEERQAYFNNLGLLVLRIGISILMLFGHGFDKLVYFGEKVVNFPDPLGLGSTASLAFTMFGEFFCSLAIAFGFFTRFATVPMIIIMLVAIFIIHGDDPWSKKEFATLYLLPYLTLLFTGAGRFSIDRLIFSKRNEP